MPRSTSQDNGAFQLGALPTNREKLLITQKGRECFELPMKQASLCKEGLDAALHEEARRSGVAVQAACRKALRMYQRTSGLSRRPSGPWICNSTAEALRLKTLANGTPSQRNGLPVIHKIVQMAKHEILREAAALCQIPRCHRATGRVQ